MPIKASISLTLSILYLNPVISDDVRPYFSEGGWRTYPSDMVARPGPCNIDIKARRGIYCSTYSVIWEIIQDGSMTGKEFMSEYAKTKPFVVRDSANNDLFRALARK